LRFAGTLSPIIPLIKGRLGMVTSSDRNTRRRWTDATIESELRVQSAALGHFPTRADLVASGLRGLWDAMRSSGGVDAWRDRVTSGASAPSHEQIAVRAHELHAKGSPGDAEAHWLAAEQELTSDSNR
jgi:Protein of unknown function (DUF2934)